MNNYKIFFTIMILGIIISCENQSENPEYIDGIFFKIDENDIDPDLDRGLLAFWKFDDCKTGDASGNNYNLKIFGQINCLETPWTKGVNLENSGYLYSNDENVDFSKFWTISLMFKVKKIRSYSAIIGKYTHKSSSPFQLSLAENKIVYEYSDGKGKKYHTIVPFSIEKDIWYNLTVVGKNEYTIFYIDNQRIYSKQTYPVFSAKDEKLYIGTPGFAKGKEIYSFNGFIDEIRLYSRSLTESEIKLIK